MIFRTGMEIGASVSVDRLMDDYHILVLAAGAEQPRDAVPGVPASDAMDYLVQQNRRNAGLPQSGAPILATGKHVVVIGGGDTGSDGTANRQGAASVTQLEILPQPPRAEDKGLSARCRCATAPPRRRRRARRTGSVRTLEMEGEGGQVTALRAEQDGAPLVLKADLVLLAMGFTGPQAGGVVPAEGVGLASYATARLASSPAMRGR